MRGSPLRQLRSTPGLVALYLPWLQIAQGLHTGANAQVVLDYSSAGNHAQNGSTTGVDANDVAFGTNSLNPGGDDYCVGPSAPLFSNANGLSVVAVWYKIGTNDIANIVNQYYTENKRQWSFCGGSTWNFSCQQNPASFNGDNVATLLPVPAGGTVHCLTGRWKPGVVTQIIRGNFAAQAVAITPATSMDEAINEPLEVFRYNHSGYTPNGHKLYALMILNRHISDGEVTKNYANLKTLLAGQGVAVS